MTNDAFPAVDSQGQAIDCAACSARPLVASGRCKPREACVADRYAKRIDRFFQQNPAFANAYLGHPYFEVRAVAAKYADVFRLSALLDDPDGSVRWSAAQRMPERYLDRMRHDPEREVRIRVASRLEPGQLATMMHDPDYYVRTVVARRLPAALLPCMADDPDRQVRLEVAQRMEPAQLLHMLRDPDPEVRVRVARRLPRGLLGPLACDGDWRVRYEVAQHIATAELRSLVDDKDEMVREAPRARPAAPRAALKGALQHG